MIFLIIVILILIIIWRYNTKIFLGILFTLGMFFLGIFLLLIFVDSNLFVGLLLAGLVLVFWFFIICKMVVSFHTKIYLGILFTILVVCLGFAGIDGLHSNGMRSVKSLFIFIIFILWFFSIFKMFFGKKDGNSKNKNIEKSEL